MTIGDNFKVIERDKVLVGVPLIPIDVSPRLDGIDARLTELQATLDGALVWLKQIDDRLDVIEARLDSSDGRMNRIDQRIDQLDARIKKLEKA